jgi:hypothetical protein
MIIFAHLSRYSNLLQRRCEMWSACFEYNDIGCCQGWGSRADIWLTTNWWYKGDLHERSSNIAHLCNFHSPLFICSVAGSSISAVYMVEWVTLTFKKQAHLCHYHWHFCFSNGAPCDFRIRTIKNVGEVWVAGAAVILTVAVVPPWDLVTVQVVEMKARAGDGQENDGCSGRWNTVDDGQRGRMKGWEWKDAGGLSS